jgi:hypothetical protein
MVASGNGMCWFSSTTDFFYIYSNQSLDKELSEVARGISDIFIFDARGHRSTHANF